MYRHRAAPVSMMDAMTTEQGQRPCAQLNAGAETRVAPDHLTLFPASELRHGRRTPELEHWPFLGDLLIPCVGRKARRTSSAGHRTEKAHRSQT